MDRHPSPQIVEVVMCALEGVLGSPDFGAGLERSHLKSGLAISGNRPCVIAGSSGSGKSTLAAQYAADGPRVTIWIDAAGDQVEPPQMAEAVEGLLLGRGSGAALGVVGTEDSIADSLGRIIRCAREVPGQMGLLVIVDDARLSGDSAGFDWLEALGAGLWRHHSRLMVTTRSVADWPPDLLCQWYVVDGDDLSLDRQEGLDLAQLIGYAASPEDVEQVRASCAGHVAFFSAIVAQARRFGEAPKSIRSASLRAWLQRTMEDCLPIEDRRILRLASLLRNGTVADLEELGVCGPLRALLRVSDALPLVRVQVRGSDEGDFFVHDLVDGYFCESEKKPDYPEVSSVISILSRRGDYGRACTLLARLGDRELSTRWLRAHGGAAATARNYSVLDRVISSLSPAAMMGDATLLVLWARVCLETGRLDESLARAKAARHIARHSKDLRSIREAMSIELTSLRLMGRFRDASELASEVVASHAGFIDDALLAEAMLCIGASHVRDGEPSRGEAPLKEAVRLAEATGQSRIRCLAWNALALVPALVHGDFAEGKRQLAAVATEAFESPTLALMIKGNLASYLSELGRYEWAEEVLGEVLSEADDLGLEHLKGFYIPVMGISCASGGTLSVGADLIRRGIEITESVGDLAETAISRVYLSLVLLAAGKSDEALKEAERALEALVRHNAMGFRLHAQYQVAACLLAGGDTAAARTWIGLDGASLLEGTNLYQSLRASVVLSEADRLDCEIDRGIQRLEVFADYVRSESPNLQLAMYSQAFPALPGLLARAVGVGTLPAHMLRMIPPESAEATMLVSREFLEDATWRDLGQRMLGCEEFVRFLARDGVPLCHVRMFAGLEVSVGGRSVRERDWKKRKARLLFVMLMIRNGHDVAREQLFESLWPGMDIERAKSNLYVTWSLVKSVLMSDAEKGTKCPYIESVGGVCHAMPQMVRTDVGDFEKAVVRSREAERAGDIREALRHYQLIGDLYRGDLLPADCYDDWFSELREHYRIEFINAMRRASDLLMSVDDPATALIFIRRAIRCDQNREDLYQAALRCQIAAGQRTSAIDTYFTCRTRLSEELGLDPSAETRALYDEILAMEDRPRPIARDSYLD